MCKCCSGCCCRCENGRCYCTCCQDGCRCRCSIYCMKVTNVVFSVIILVIGLSLISVGVVYIFHGPLEEALPDSSKSLRLFPIFTIVVGCFVLLTSTFGIVSALTEKWELLTAYGLILIILIILEMTLGGFADNAIKPYFYQSVKHKLKKAFYQYNENGKMKEFIDSLQEELKCCVVFEQGRDHKSYNYLKSCETAHTLRFTDRCKKSFYNHAVNAMDSITSTVLDPLIFQILGAILGLYLAFLLWREDKVLVT